MGVQEEVMGTRLCHPVLATQELLMDVLSFASTEDATRAEAACFQQIGAA